MAGVAVKVTLVPEHIVVADAAMETDAANTGITVMIIGSEVAGLPEMQLAFEVKVQVIIS